MAREAPNRHEKGDKRYKEMVARDQKISKDLPFQFIKTPKSSQARREIFYICAGCQKIGLVNKNTVGVTCSGCKLYNRVEDVPNFASEEALEEYLQSLANEEFSTDG